ncbi:MAG: YggS family pyridoxal phosphate enzyme, partial [Clostridia bacterium]|nr:YggS family pyridoxal phosphate enzyme [Clostridia bacterium]
MSIADNIKSVKSDIERAAKLSNRDVSAIKLVAVTKTKPIEMLKEARRAGLFDFGENRPQEIVLKH